MLGWLWKAVKFPVEALVLLPLLLLLWLVLSCVDLFWKWGGMQERS